MKVHRIPYSAWLCPPTIPPDEHTQTVEQAVERINKHFAEQPERTLHVWRIGEGDLEVQRLFFLDVFRKLEYPPDLFVFDDERGEPPWGSLPKKEKNRQHKVLVLDTARAVWPDRVIRNCNYGEFQFVDPIYDMNGHLFPQDIELPGDVSSPPVYNWGNGAKFFNRYPGNLQRVKERLRWESMIDQINMVRSCLRKSPSIIVWLSNRLWVGDYIEAEEKAGRFVFTPGQKAAARWWWDTVVTHLALNGVKECVYWDHMHPEESDRGLEVLRHCDNFFKRHRNLPQISLDADEIRTGDYVTTFAEFSDHEHIPMNGEI